MGSVLPKIRDNPGSQTTVFQTAFAKLNIISRKRKKYSKSYWQIFFCMLEWNPSQRCELQHWIASSSAHLTLRSNPDRFFQQPIPHIWLIIWSRKTRTYIHWHGASFFSERVPFAYWCFRKSLCVNTSLFVLSSGGKNETQKFLHRSQSNIRAWIEAKRVSRLLLLTQAQW